MDKHNTARTNMIRTNTSYCDLHAADTAAITDYAPTVLKIKNKLVLIDALNIVANGTSTGVTLDTKALRTVMETDTVKLCGGLKALAGATNNNTMYDAADYTEPKLSKLPKETVDDICSGIQALAFANKVALAPKGISATDISDTATAVNLYRLASSNPRDKIIEIKNAGDQIEPIIRDIIDNLMERQLDQLTNTLKTSNNAFFSGYYLSREIVDPAKHPTEVKGKFIVKGATPEKPVPGAILTLQSDTNNYTIKGNITAEFQEKIKNGTYIGHADAVGFKPTVLNSFELKLGKTVELTIEMELL